jgi:hypothetical protein
MTRRLATFEEFWPYYVARHSRPANRALHFLGTSLALAAAVTAATLAQPLWLLMVPLGVYGPAWIGHTLVERNHSATFRHPVWSLRGDLRMYRLMWMARMEPELDRARALFPAEA